MQDREKRIRESNLDYLSDTVHLLTVIDQLRAERDERIRYNRKLGVENYDLKDQLDEIREAWEPIGYNLDFSNASDCEHLDYSSFSENVTFGDLRKLAKLIGKEKE